MTLLRKALSFGRSLAGRALFPVFERLLPTDARLWCFCSWDRHFHTLDNPRAVLEALPPDADVVAVVLQKSPGQGETGFPAGRVRFVPAESLRGAWYLARSRVVLLGYGLRVMSSYAGALTAKHLVIQLWHGIPLRRIGRLFPRETWWASETPLYAAMVASSERERDNLAKAFSPIRPERIWLTGLPRNDFIVGSEAALPSDYRGHLEELRRVLAGRRLVLYAPTWRDQQADHYQFSGDERRQLEQLLRSHHAVLGIRGHANVRHLERYADAADSPDIISLNHYPDVNVLLRDTAVLITDYSSIYLDFLLTGRPILHFAYDFEAYLEKRVGFFYEVKEAFAGPVPRNFGELVHALDQALGSGVSDPESYGRVRDLFHQHPSGSAAEVGRRILALVRSRSEGGPDGTSIASPPADCGGRGEEHG